MQSQSNQHCWFQMKTDSVTERPISHLRCLQNHIKLSYFCKMMTVSKRWSGSKSQRPQAAFIQSCAASGCEGVTCFGQASNARKNCLPLCPKMLRWTPTHKTWQWTILRTGNWSTFMEFSHHQRASLIVKSKSVIREKYKNVICVHTTEYNTMNASVEKLSKTACCSCKTRRRLRNGDIRRPNPFDCLW